MPLVSLSWPLVVADDTVSNTSRLAANSNINVPNYPWTMEGFSGVRWTVAVESVSGGPTTWTITIVPQWLVPHTIGDFFTAPVWLPFDAAQKTAVQIVADGEDWATFTQASSIPARQSRSYRNFGYGMGLNIALSALAGGVTPSINLTVTATLKG